MKAGASVNVHAEVRRLMKLPVAALREEYLTAFGEPTRSGNKPYLVKRAVWRMRAMRLTNRIEKLERDVRKGNPVICPVCQFAVGCVEIPPEPIRFEVPVPQAFGETEPIDGPANDFCKGCARRIVFRLG